MMLCASLLPIHGSRLFIPTQMSTDGGSLHTATSHRQHPKLDQKSV
jgi:hypothetical protein